ncbi:MAG TPA: hypothetical protein PKG54_04345 [Phycisphaerae bacterium]|nr:hypothetical protein [Phycisphaerae bacterium]HOB73735.1 hypothetical protein [Phycisphaerae bacterium]HOJ53391.1 hypothetical protein [Phycisphaerae bacterium]HOL25485.1 hypothetical protein [Phycisphaerae bacterium]HPP19838.1 hypothetical protein [Phycisphaerae bacterium]
MARWVICHLCGCTGVHRDPLTNTEYTCPNGCEGGRIYEHTHPDWFQRLVRCGAEVFEDKTPTKPQRAVGAR